MKVEEEITLVNIKTSSVKKIRQSLFILIRHKKEKEIHPRWLVMKELFLKFVKNKNSKRKHKITFGNIHGRAFGNASFAQSDIFDFFKTKKATSQKTKT